MKTKVEVMAPGAAFSVGGIELHQVERSRAGTYTGTTTLRFAPNENGSAAKQRLLSLHLDDKASFDKLANLGLKQRSQSQSFKGRSISFAVQPGSLLHMSIDSALGVRKR